MKTFRITIFEYSETEMFLIIIIIILNIIPSLFYVRNPETERDRETDREKETGRVFNFA